MVVQAKWTTLKASVHPKKMMSCVRWDWKGVLYYELLLENQTINSNKYYFQIDQLKATCDEKILQLVDRKHIIIHQGNARSHVSLMTRQKLLQLGWKFWLNAIFTRHFHLFRSLQNSLNKNNINSQKDCKKQLEQFFAQKDIKFWEDGIMKLPERWQKVVEQMVNMLFKSSWWKKKNVFRLLIKMEAGRHALPPCATIERITTRSQN